MSIASTGGGNPLITVISPAKNGTLGTQGAIDADQIVLDTSLTAVNNGNITAPLIGRLLILRRGLSTEETKKITEGAATDTTIRVHEDWTVPPTSGDTYDISYVLGDTTAFTGMSLSAKTGVYEFSRGLFLGDSSTFTFFSTADQEATEIRDNATNYGITITNNARMDVGYKIDSNPGAGALLNTINDGVGEPSILLNSGATLKLYDAINFSYRAATVFSSSIDATVDADNWKNVSLTSNARLHGSSSYRNVSWNGGNDTSETIVINFETTIDTWTLTGTYGFRTVTGNTSTETLEIRDVRFVGTNRNILVASNKTWNVVNPVWTIDTGSQALLTFETGTGNQVNELVSFDGRVRLASGSPVSGSTIYIYEGLTNQNLPASNQMFTEAAGNASSDILLRTYTSGTTPALDLQSYGDHVVKTYRYGYNPFVAQLDTTSPIVQNIVLVADTALSAATAADAISNGSPNIFPIEHGPNASGLDKLPLKVFHYDNGTGTIPSAGQIVSGTTSNATGSVLEVAYGDNADAYLVLSGWNGVQFTDNETIGNGAGWSATADTATFDEEYTWEYFCSGSTLQIVYDYDAAKMAQDPVLADSIYKEAVIWGEDEQSNMIYSNGSSYFTERNATRQEGVWLSSRGAGTVSYMTSDSGSQFVPPQTFTFELTGIQLNSEVRVYNSANNQLLAGEETTVSPTFSYSYVYSGADITAYVVIFNLFYKEIRLTGLTLSNSDQSIPIQQNIDRVYSNP